MRNLTPRVTKRRTGERRRRRVVTKRKNQKGSTAVAPAAAAKKRNTQAQPVLAQEVALLRKVIRGEKREARRTGYGMISIGTC